MATVYRRGFDAHTHLDHTTYSGDRQAVLSRACTAGVQGMAIAAAAPDNWGRVLATAEQTGAVACLGLHPWWVTADSDAEQAVARLEQYLPSVVGEIGLDRLRGDWQAQQEVFAAQLTWAVQRDLPVVIHAVRAVDEVLAQVQRSRARHVVIHGFVGSVAQVQRAMSLGVHLSVSATRAYGRRAAAIAAIDPGRLMLETDCPQRRADGSMSEPADLVAVAQCVATVRDTDAVDLFAATGDTARRFFRCQEIDP